MVWNERYITAGDGTRLFCREAGEGTPLLMIHGAACDSEFFLSLGARMGSQYRVILYDRRGYGRSGGVTGAHDSTAHFSRLASDAACVLRQMGAEKATVLGCSYGALIALYLAGQYPELVDRTLIHEPPAYSMLPDDTEGWEKIGGILRCIEQRKFVRALNRFLLFLASASAPSERPMTGAEMESFMRNGLYFIEHDFAFGFDRSLVVPRLSGQTGPAFLRGVNGAGTPLWECAKRLAERQGCAVYDVPGGHNGAQEQPDEFGDALCELLEHTVSPGREHDGANGP